MTQFAYAEVARGSLGGDVAVEDWRRPEAYLVDVDQDRLRPSWKVIRASSR